MQTRVLPDGSRICSLLPTDELKTHRYDDARTLYEGARRVGGFVVEGYGQTECVAACTVSFEGDFVPGHVGAPSPCNAVKLIDVPEMNYFAKDQVGEMPEETKLTLDADGWLHTGDIGKWTDRGTLKIVDRKKHIFKLSQGEYVAPEKIECIYLSSKYVAQCFVYGESLKSRLVGVIVPNQEILTRIAEFKLDVGRGCSFEELCNSTEVKELVLEDILEVGKAAGLASLNR
uniref:long-chain-fatty-acid--CoA ligase n=1 Tax=Ditylenchus dipsaci TaxID=166011 RepID=A0A915CNF1_9BILA